MPHKNPHDHPECEHCNLRVGTQEAVEEMRGRVESIEAMGMESQSDRDAMRHTLKEVQATLSIIQNALLGNKEYGIEGLVAKVEALKSGRAQAATIGGSIGAAIYAIGTFFTKP